MTDVATGAPRKLSPTLQESPFREKLKKLNATDPQQKVLIPLFEALAIEDEADGKADGKITRDNFAKIFPSLKDNSLFDCVNKNSPDKLAEFFTQTPQRLAEFKPLQQPPAPPAAASGTESTTVELAGIAAKTAGNTVVDGVGRTVANVTDTVNNIVNPPPPKAGDTGTPGDAQRRTAADVGNKAGEVILSLTGVGQVNRAADTARDVTNTLRDNNPPNPAPRTTTPPARPSRREREQSRSEESERPNFFERLLGGFLNILSRLAGGQDTQFGRWLDRQSGYDDRADGQNGPPSLGGEIDTPQGVLAGLPTISSIGANAGASGPTSTDSPQGVLNGTGTGTEAGTGAGTPPKAKTIDELKAIAIDNGINPEPNDTIESLTKKIMDNLKAEAAERHIDITGCNDIDSILEKMPDGPSESGDTHAADNGLGGQGDQPPQETPAAKYSRQADEYAKLHDPKQGAWTGPVNQVRKKLSELYTELSKLNFEDPKDKEKAQHIADEIGPLENKLSDLYPKNFEATANGFYKSLTLKVDALKTALDSLSDTPENATKRTDLQAKLDTANHDVTKWAKIKNRLEVAHQKITELDAKIEENKRNRKLQENNPEVIKGIDQAIASLTAERNSYVAQIEKGQISENNQTVNLTDKVENEIQQEESKYSKSESVAGLI